MRILAITSQYPRPGYDGIAAFNRQQFAALAADHELGIIAPVAWTDVVSDYARGRPTKSRDRRDARIDVYHPIYFYTPRFWEHRYGQFYWKSVRNLAQRVIAEFKPEALLSCWAHPDGWATTQIARQAGIPVVIKVIGSDVLVLTRNARRRLRIAQALCEADGVIAVSEDLANHVRRLGVDPRRLQVVSEGVDQALFFPADRDSARSRLGLPATGKMLLFVGNLLVSKGAKLLVEACRELQRRGTSFCCYLVGNGPYKRHLEALIKLYSLENQVHLLGHIPLHLLPDWYGACDVVVLPSYSEGIPNVLREAGACGRPFVATDVGGIREIADPSCSRLVLPGEVMGLADALEDMLNSTPMPADAPFGRHNVSWEVSAQRVAKCLQAAMDARPSLGGGVTRRLHGPAGDADHQASASLGRREVAARAGSCELKCRDDSSLRILIVTGQYPRLAHPQLAPFNQQQFRALARSHDLRIISPLPWTEFVADMARLDIRPLRYRNRDGISVENPIYFYLPKIWQHLHGRNYLRGIRRTVLRQIAAFRPQVLLACWSDPDGWATVQIAKEVGLPVVVKVHGSDVLVLPQDPRRKVCVAEALRAADGVVAVSHHLGRAVAELGIDPSRIRVIENGVDTEVFSPGDQRIARSYLGLPCGERIVLYIGNLLLSKGIGVLVDACKILHENGTPFRCCIVGEGRGEATIRSMIHQFGLEPWVTLHGVVSSSELTAWYRASDVVALPSFSEGLPNVLRESLACGKPFAATSIGGIPEIAHPSYSRLTPAGNSAMFAASLKEMLDHPPAVDPTLIARHTQSWETSANGLADYLRTIIDSSHSPNTKVGSSRNVQVLK